MRVSPGYDRRKEPCNIKKSDEERSIRSDTFPPMEQSLMCRDDKKSMSRMEANRDGESGYITR